jgi:signal transduction histidine kinase/tetratricopeptide (TPR) repeat protein
MDLNHAASCRQTVSMQLFETLGAIQRLESELSPAGVNVDFNKRIELAWYLRQSNSHRALELIDQASRDANVTPAASARMALIRAEFELLSGHPEVSIEMARQVLTTQESLGDHIGCADASMLLARAVASTGRGGGQLGYMTAAIEFALKGGDPHRHLFMRVLAAVNIAFQDPRSCQDQWKREFEPQLATAHPETVAMMNGLAATIAYGVGDIAASVKCFIRALEGMQATGQVNSMLGAYANISEAFNALNDRDASLDWAQRSLQVARKVGWPFPLGTALMRVAENLRKIERATAAKPLLHEALELFKPFFGSRNYGILLAEVGQNALACGDDTLALKWFTEMLALSQDTQGGDIQALESTARIGMAKSLRQLGRLTEAWEQAQLGLELERKIGKSFVQIEVLQLLAQICMADSRHTQALELLTQALDLGERIVGHTITPSVFLALGEVHAALAQFEPAYRDVVRANALRDQLHIREAENRATALEIRLSIQKSIAEAVRERERADLLQQSTATLQLLGEIGQEITAELDPERVFEVLYRHVNSLLSAECFTVYLMDANGLGMTSAFDMEAGERIETFHIALNDPHSFSARCVVERRELAVDLSASEADPSYIAGSMRTNSALFAPLAVQNQVLGVMSIQSVKTNAYGESERQIFRSICAYAAIALANAAAYRQLHEAQERLVAQEKLSALGALVAGVAHELNTPIGNCLLSTTSLQDRNVLMTEQFEKNNLKRSDLKAYFDDVAYATDLTTRGLTNAARLVQSFKQVAVDRTSEQRRIFDLRATAVEVLATLAHDIERAGHRIAVDIPDGIEVDAYPGPFGQVLTALVVNALAHAFATKPQGRMQIVATPLDADQLELVFSDDGCGIAPAHLKRVFDPFFTTQMGRGSNGLGLSICHNIASAILGGTLTVQSSVGKGTSFKLTLPRVAPRH